MRQNLLALAAIAGVVSCISCARTDTSRLPRMGVDLAFEQKNKCRGVSPQIRLTGAPAGVASYDVELKDLDAPRFHHWKQTLPDAAGPVIREGAGTGYVGPCPPSGTHRYKVTVLARDGEKRAVGYGETTLVVGR